MGGGASTVNQPTADISLPISQVLEPAPIPISTMAGRLKVFQHSLTGNVIVLVNDDVKDIPNLVNPKEWFSMTVSDIQKEYLQLSKFEVTPTVSTQGSSRGRHVHSSSEIPDSTKSSSREVKRKEMNLPPSVLSSTAPIFYRPPDAPEASKHSHRRSSVPQRSAKARLRLQKELSGVNLTKECKYCGELFDATLFSDIDIEEHVNACSITTELQGGFKSIDGTIGPIMLHLSAQNHTNMNAAITRAIASFQRESAWNNTVFRLLRAVLSIRSSASDGKWLQTLQSDIEEAISRLSSAIRQRSGRRTEVQDKGEGRTSQAYRPLSGRGSPGSSDQVAPHRGSFSSASSAVDGPGGSSSAVFEDLDEADVWMRSPRAAESLAEEKRGELSGRSAWAEVKAGDKAVPLPSSLTSLPSAHITTSADTSSYDRLLDVLHFALAKLKSKRELLRKYRRVLYNVTDFQFLRGLSKGAFGTVYLARKNDAPDKAVAVKVINKDLVREHSMLAQMKRERVLWTSACRFGDEFIVKLICTFQTQTTLFMAMEYMQGGDCMTLLLAMGRLPERLARHIVAEVAFAIKSLHDHGIVHRDIKPDNVMISMQGHVKIADFGMAVPCAYIKVHDSNNTNNISNNTNNNNFNINQSNVIERNWSMPSSPLPNSTSTPDTRARELSTAAHSTESNLSNSNSSFFLKPEANGLMMTPLGNLTYACKEAVLSSPYDHTVDWWALGVMLFHLVSGVTPFEGTTMEATEDAICLGTIHWDYLPPECSDGLRQIVEEFLGPDRLTRLGSAGGESVLTHRYFTGIDFKTLFFQPSPLVLAELDSPINTAYFDSLTEEEANNVPKFETEGEFSDKDEFCSFSYTANS